jgi:ATP-binding protein involved in chromosome partitioning
MSTLDDVRERLAEIRPHGLPRDILSAGLVRDVVLHADVVRIQFHPGPLPAAIVEATVADIKRAVGALPGIGAVEVALLRAAEPDLAAIPGVADIIAVSSAKGGVGKSTVAVNLSCALQRRGLRIGVLDADVYGPSLPTMLGIAGRPEVTDQRTVIPLEQFGLRVMSMGFFLDEGSPVVWRGPLVTGLVRQFLSDVRWGELDVLVVDLPPGTGDVALTLVQQVPLAGGVIVTTPQPASVIDVERGIAMFQQVNTPILGVIENMTGYECPTCGTRDALFGAGGAAHLERTYGVSILGRIPLEPAVRLAGDAGTPIVVAQPEHPISRLYGHIAEQVLDGIAAERAAAPRIVG